MSALGRVCIAVLFIVVFDGSAQAASQAGGEPHFTAEQIIGLAKQIEREIAARGAQVAIISRVGRPSSTLPNGMEFTHVAFAVYSTITTTDGRILPGYAMYNLYQDSQKRNASYLFQDYPLDYYASVHALKAGVIIPKPELQRRLLEVISSDIYPNLHNPRYSAIANPYNTKFQNCTEFVLDVINAAIYQTGDKRQIKTNIEAYFEPQPVEVNPFKLWLGSLFMSDIFISDHQGQVRTATFWSIARYMQYQDIADEVFTVSVKLPVLIFIYVD